MSLPNPDLVAKSLSASLEVGPPKTDAGGSAVAKSGVSVARLQGIVDVARGEIAQGRHRDAARTLEPAFDQLRLAEPQRYDDIGERQLTVVAASAHSLLGQCREDAGEDGPAQEAFAASVELFGKVGTELDLNAREWADYGDALSAIGRGAEGMYALSRARELGFRSAESLRRLGELYLAEGSLSEAIAVLSEAVELTTMDWRAAKLLAEATEADGRGDQAGGMFVLAGGRAAAADRFDDGLKLFEAAARLAPTDPVALVGVGEMLRLLGRHAEALESLNRAVDLAPASALTVGTRGRLRRLLGDLTGAVRDLERARSLDPSLDWVSAALAQALRDSGRVEDALGVADEAIERMPESEAALTLRAELLWSTGEMDAALRDVDAALERSPDASWPLALKGELLRGRGQLEDALKALNRAIEAAGMPFPWALAIKGQTLRALGRRKKARAAFEQAIALDPTLLWAYEELAALLLDIGEPDTALAHAEHAIREGPETPRVLTLKARILSELGKHTEARDTASRAVELDEHSFRARLELSRALFATGDREGALREANAAVDRDPRAGDAYAVRAWILRADGRSAEALQDFRMCAELDPTNLAGARNLAQALAESDRYEEARGVLEGILEETPEDTDVLRMLGYTLFNLGMVDAAASTFALVKTLLPGDTTPISDLAFVQNQRGSCRAALATLTAALDIDPDNPWALTVQGITLSDMGEFEGALTSLARARLAEPNVWLCVHATAWALEQLGLERAAEAHAAYREAVELDPTNLYSMRGRTDTRPPGEGSIASGEYRRILEQAVTRAPNTALVTLMGWCRFCLREYEQAIDLYLNALSRTPPGNHDAAVIQLDLALAVLASGKDGLATREYERARQLGRELEPERWRGLLAVAIGDLRWATAHGHLEPAARDRELDELTQDITTVQAAAPASFR